jgi:hypothetical protein
MADHGKVGVADIKIRVKEPLRARVEAAARERGVSMNAELISRLEKSFAQDDQLADTLGSKDVVTFMQSIAAAMRKAGEIAAASKRPRILVTNPPWLSEPYAFEQAVKAANGVIEAFRPPGDPSPPSTPAHGSEAEASSIPEAVSSMALQFARALIDAVVNEQHFSIEELKESTLFHMKQLQKNGRALSPGDTPQNGAGGINEGEHQSPGQVQLAPKVRTRRARQSNR